MNTSSIFASASTIGWRPQMFACVPVVIAVAASGCGGSESSSTAPITLRPPTTPLAADCGLTGGGSAKDAEQPPTPGSYSYATDGTRTLLGETKRVSRLPKRTKVIVTESLRDGAQSCFKLQRAYESDLGETGVFVISGADTYLRSGRFQAGADITDLNPDPSPLVISGSELDWSGTFRGQTSGRYEANVVGRKRIRVGGASVPVVGIETRVSYAGDIEGFERSTRWFSLERSLVVEESVTSERAFGLDRLRLKYESRLLSLEAR